MNDIIWIEAICNDYYQFINKLRYLKLNILDIKYINSKILLKIYYNDYKKIQKYLISYKFVIKKRKGLLNIFYVIKNNYVFLLCVLIGLLLYFFGQNMILKINIIHENKDIRELLEDELDFYGIKVLSFKKKYSELYSIREQILDKYPDKLDWIEFDIDGMVLNLRVEERIITKQVRNNNICNVIAKKDGVITNIKVEAGESSVMINDYVRSGDILINGVINYDDKIVRKTCAKGRVFAVTWWNVNVKVPLEVESNYYTGKKRYNLAFEYNSSKKDLFKSRINKHESNYKKMIDIVGFKLYLKQELEVQKNINKITSEEALNIGINKAEENLKKVLSEFDTIIDKKVLKKKLNNSTMDIEVFFVVNELISEQVIISGEGID